MILITALFADKLCHVSFMNIKAATGFSIHGVYFIKCQFNFSWVIEQGDLRADAWVVYGCHWGWGRLRAASIFFPTFISLVQLLHLSVSIIVLIYEWLSYKMLVLLSFLKQWWCCCDTKMYQDCEYWNVFKQQIILFIWVLRGHA